MKNYSAQNAPLKCLEVVTNRISVKESGVGGVKICVFLFACGFKGQRKLEMNSPFFSYESFAHAVSGAAVSFHLYNNPYARLGCIFIYLL